MLRKRFIDRLLCGLRVFGGRRACTLYYIVGKYQDKDRAATLVDWLLGYFEIAALVKAEFLRASRGLRMADFEDAVVASAAEALGCRYVVTRNVRGFERSPVPATTPEEFMAMQSAGKTALKDQRDLKLPVAGA